MTSYQRRYSTGSQSRRRSSASEEGQVSVEAAGASVGAGTGGAHASFSLRKLLERNPVSSERALWFWSFFLCACALAVSGVYVERVGIDGDPFSQFNVAALVFFGLWAITLCTSWMMRFRPRKDGTQGWSIFNLFNYVNPIKTS